MTTYSWEKKESAGSWVPFEGTPTAQNPTEEFEAGTWDVRVTVSTGSETETKTKLAYVSVEDSPSYTGPLDLVPGAVVAYGVRALSAAWRGQNIFRLLRDSDNAEMDFAADAVTGGAPTAAIATWLDGADGYIVTWYDQSGNWNDIENAITSTSSWTANLINGVGGFVGSASTDLGITANNSFNNDGFSVFSVGRYPFRCDFIGGVPEGSLTFLTGPDASTDLYNGTDQEAFASFADASADQVVLLDAVNAIGTHSMNQNGAALVATPADMGTDVGSLTFTSLTVGIHGAPSVAAAAELIVYSQVITTNRTAIRQNIASYYGITLA